MLDRNVEKDRLMELWLEREGVYQAYRSATGNRRRNLRRRWKKLEIAVERQYERVDRAY